MNESSFASRYAEAYLAAEGLDLENKVAEVENFLELLENCRELKILLVSASFSWSEKTRLLDSLLQKKALSPLFHHFLAVIIKGGRGFYLTFILDEFMKLADLKRGIIRGYCYTADELDASLKQRLVKSLEKKYSSRIKLRYILDPDLIGGVRIALGGTRIDGSLKAVQEKLHRELLERR